MESCRLQWQVNLMGVLTWLNLDWAIRYDLEAYYSSYTILTNYTCEKHHGISPADRENSGLQIRFPYTSPHDDEQFGSLLLTFYPTTFRLLVQRISCSSSNFIFQHNKWTIYTKYKLD